MPKGTCYLCSKTGIVKFLPTSIKGQIIRKPYCKECAAVLTLLVLVMQKAKTGNKDAQEMLEKLDIKEGVTND